ncbi:MULTISPECIES: protein-L-isoaspartate(D-aspartate) O-methyltransferase [unclassified Sphingomonas]|jgi:protein-L-isoaspartate(D-aspartate) O-methyltransferase|uniref:protein-L-isoaspartate(D-aspartate) O-methyltransferase n=1 Tax=unclassified Sphingomonas TaxID=196159 RepID=UPI000E103361|nr:MULTISPECIES: protein-L-isoaspartate(D-aspartate) O-methyltransferase [unclassified Sphingomonas]AXJ95471.1 protein-L-isoaspartate(D-aspartate) O-methyltransferase [Sphingomonas sp. FARSPH]
MNRSFIATDAHFVDASAMSRRFLPSAALLAVSLAGCTHASPQPVDMLGALAKARAGQSPAQQRAQMVADIRADIHAADPAADTPALGRALAVIGTLPREDFVDPAGRAAAYVDLPQAIGYGQTISDPYVVAVMTAALDLPADGSANVLDVGTGSGYQAAVLARLARHVASIEIVEPLARAADVRLHHMGYANVAVRAGDGFMGWPEHAPFDGIVVAASATEVPRPLLDQLKPGGRIVMPIGASDTSTQLLRVTKRPDGALDRCRLGPALFVPFTGGRVAPFVPRALTDRTIPLCFKAPIVGVL